MRKLPEERQLKNEGEELAKIAVRSGVGSKQLNTLHRQAKTRSVPYLEAFVQRQIGRIVRGTPIFPEDFGEALLELLRKYAEDKGSLQKVLMYAAMIYPYYQRQHGLERARTISQVGEVGAPAAGLEKAVEPTVKDFTQRYGFEELTGSKRGEYTVFTVRLSRFYGNPKTLADEIERKIRDNVPEASRLNFRVWIESTGRR